MGLSPKRQIRHNPVIRRVKNFQILRKFFQKKNLGNIIILDRFFLDKFTLLNIKLTGQAKIWEFRTIWCLATVPQLGLKIFLVFLE